MMIAVLVGTQHAELKVQAMVSQEDVSRAKDQIIETQTKLNDSKSEVRPPPLNLMP